MSRHRAGALQRGRCHTTNSCRPGLIVGILRVICDCSCTTKRFHSDHDKQECRIGMPWFTSLHQSLSRVPKVAPFFRFFFGRRGPEAQTCLRHDGIQHVQALGICTRSQRHCILGGGLVHAFVSAYQTHRASMKSSSFAS